MVKGKGQSTVEFALALPILFIIIIGIAEFSLSLYNYLVMTREATNAARIAGVLDKTDSEIINLINKRYNSLIDTYFLSSKIEHPETGEEGVIKITRTDKMVKIGFNYHVYVDLFGYTIIEFVKPVVSSMYLEERIL
ncbi:MAG: pilus assembly protein [bacterium]|nr:pilus assembly protein [bacterium]